MKNCPKCEQTKEDEEFCWRNRAKGTRQVYCKECRKTYDAAYWKGNRTRLLPIKTQRTKANRRALGEFVRSIKDKPCTDCRVSYSPWIMEFDHLHNKTANVADLVAGNYSKQAILDEIIKCELVCANCHRERTHRRKQAA